DIVEHLLAMLPSFDLAPFQYPTGADLEGAVPAHLRFGRGGCEPQGDNHEDSERTHALTAIGRFGKVLRPYRLRGIGAQPEAARGVVSKSAPVGY
ncbi:MAG: hypothetical protein AAFU79_33770, partial [Myxococcota bacterium]